MDEPKGTASTKPIQKLAGQTLVYGLSTVIPRTIGYLMVIYHTRLFDRAEYGVVTELYAYVTFLVVLLTYGMETGFFRFSQHKEKRDLVYGTAFLSLAATSALFVVLVTLFQHPIASVLEYGDHPEFILWFGIILGLDAMTAIPFARLRVSNRPVRFASYKLISVLVNVGATFFFYAFCPAFTHWAVIDWLYRPEIGVGYVFIANLIGSLTVLALLLPEIFRFRIRFDFGLWKEMLLYSLPLMVAGLAGNINEAFDRVALKHLIPKEDLPMEQLGVYGANAKLAVLMVLFTQMFRYAAEPFFFNNAKASDARETIAEIMKLFVISGLAIFLGVTLYLDLFKHFVRYIYWDGLAVVPVLLLANLGLGVYYNLTIGFKLNNMTHLGIRIAFVGAAVSIAGNLLFVPVAGYHASAWSHLVCYSVMGVMTWQITRKVYPIPYDWKNMAGYTLLALALYAVSRLSALEPVWLNLVKNTLLLGIFIVFALRKEQLLQRYKNGQL